jgi:phosphoribosyl 1,2-cyclic phosphodiesterase
MYYASLASGSKGNCHAVGDAKRILLIDAGISRIKTRNKLQEINWEPQLVQGVALTHEHKDHISGLKGIVKRTNWDILATKETLQAAEENAGVKVPESRWVQLTADQTLDWNGWKILPFAVPHDAVDPVAFRIENPGGYRIAIVTDLGRVTKSVVENCKDLALLALESNHDIEMLRGGPYPAALKNRILSRVGHLSNDGCAKLLSKVISPNLRHVVLAHLSQKNNDPALAKLSAASAIAAWFSTRPHYLNIGHILELHVAMQDEVLKVSVSREYVGTRS